MNRLTADQFNLPIFDVIISFLMETGKHEPAIVVEKTRLDSINFSYTGLVNGIAKLSAIISKLEYSIIHENDIGVDILRFWLAVDIEVYLTTLRSMSDSLACIIAKFSRIYGTLPYKSLNDLLKWKEKNQMRLTDNLRDLLSGDFSWFRDVRTMRDSLLHSNAEVMIFNTHEDYRFAVTRGFKGVLKKEMPLKDEIAPIFDRLQFLTKELFGFMNDSAGYVYTEIKDVRREGREFPL